MSVAASGHRYLGSLYSSLRGILARKDAKDLRESFILVALYVMITGVLPKRVSEKRIDDLDLLDLLAERDEVNDLLCVALVCQEIVNKKNDFIV